MPAIIKIDGAMFHCLSWIERPMFQSELRLYWLGLFSDYFDANVDDLQLSIREKAVMLLILLLKSIFAVIIIMKHDRFRRIRTNRPNIQITIDPNLSLFYSRISKLIS